jgi:hypothetical protein
MLFILSISAFFTSMSTPPRSSTTLMNEKKLTATNWIDLDLKLSCTVDKRRSGPP